MQYTAIKTGRLADDVTNQIKEAIFQGEYQPGEKIPSEHELVELFRVSRVIIREAIRNLEQTGFVERKRGPKGGAFILPFNHNAISQVVKDLFRLSKGTVKEIMEVRLEIEPIVAGLAAERANEDELILLKNNLDIQPKIPGRKTAKGNIDFHRLVAKCSHNPIYEMIINILCDFSKVLETARKNSIKQGFIKIICYYPQISFEILPPRSPLTVSIFVIDPVKDIENGHMPEKKEGISLYISKWKKYDPETVPVEAKAAANYLNGMLAGLEAREKGFQKAVMLDTQGFLAEGGTESIFLVINETIITPCLGTILESISRKSILEAARLSGLKTVEKRVKPAELMQADEIFLSGTPAKILPVRQIQDKILKNAPGPMSLRLGRLIDDIVKGKDRRFSDWLSYL